MAAREPSRFEESHPLRMFSTFVWRGEVAAQTRDPLNAGIVGALNEMRGGAPAPGAAWQSDQTLHEHDAFGELVACVDEAAVAALAYLKIGHDGFAITACWANVNAPGAGHAMHSHPNNLLSGIYYVTTPDGADTVNFHEPRPQAAIIRPPVTELTADNTDQVVVRVSAGTLLVFPAWLQHSVDTNQSGEARISVSFNIMLASYAERMSKPLWEPGQA